MKIVTIGILFLGCIAINFVLRKVLAGVKNSTGVFAIIKKIFPWMEVAFWAAFVYWVNSIFITNNQSLVQLIFVVMGFALFFWFFLRDYIAGIQLKSRFNFSVGQTYRSGEVNGVIRKVRLLYLEIKSDAGGDYKIPFSQIDQKSLQLNILEKGSGESIITVELDAALDESSVAQRILELVINSPWSSHKSSPIVTVLNDENGLKTYEIACMLNGDDSGRKLRELIQSELGRKRSNLRKQN